MQTSDTRTEPCCHQYIREENAMQQMIINIIEIRLTEGEKKRRYQI
jgi:hypothetical protein